MMRLLQWHRSLAVGLALLGLLLVACTALLSGNTYWYGRAALGDDRLLTISNALSPSNFLPRPYIERIKAAPGVASVTEFSSVALFLANDRHVFTGVIVDKDQIGTTFPRMGADTAALFRWQQRKDAILVSEKLLEQQHLAIGATVAARLFFGDAESNQTFYVAGTFGTQNELKCTTCVILGRDFADLALPSYRGVVGSFHVRLHAAADKVQAKRLLDALFVHESPSTRSAEFLPAESGFLNDLIDLRYLVFLAVWMTLVAALFLPGLCANLLAINYSGNLSLLLVLGQRKVQLLVRYLGLALGTGLLLGAGGAFLAWMAGNYLFDELPWLRLEAPGSALQAALGAGLLLTTSAWSAVASVVARLDPGDLFRDITD